MKMLESQYHDHVREYDGYCRSCDDVTNFGGVEPDARGYPCDMCDKKKVYGIEEALMHGWIEFTDEDTPSHDEDETRTRILWVETGTTEEGRPLRDS